MRIGFIIAEYNPLHNGHIKHIQKTKTDLNCDKLVCLMSGDCTQRGEFAVKDKYERATWAIKAGFDMVIEIPVQYVLSSAQLYATGASKIISYFDCEKVLSFGSELGKIEILTIIKNILLSDEFVPYLKKHLEKKTNSYAKANHLALAEYLKDKNLPESLADIINNPNNILAIEYLKAISLDITPYTIKREGSFENSIDPKNPSAMKIREYLNNNLDISEFVPNYVKDSLTSYTDYSEKLFSIVKFELSKKKDLSNIYGMVDGIDNRFISQLKNSSTLNEYIQNVKTKRYTQTAINRALLNALIENKNTQDSLINNSIDYLNILAIKESSKDLFGIIENELITKPSDYTQENKDRKSVV